VIIDKVGPAFLAYAVVAALAMTGRAIATNCGWR